MTFPFTANKNSSFDYLSRAHRPREMEELTLLATNYLTEQKNRILYHKINFSIQLDLMKMTLEASR